MQSSMAQMRRGRFHRHAPETGGTRPLKLGGRGATGDSISFTNKYMEWNGAPSFVMANSLHPLPNAYWEESCGK